MVISNVRSWDRTDVVVRSMHDLVVTLLEHRTQPKAVVIDEASTHFDARTYREEVANQWTPAAKRMAKMGVVFCGLICHSGKDLHPEAKRLTNLAYWKHSKQEASWFEEWQGDADYPRSPLFPGVVERLEIYFGTYDPDEPATWSWDLRPGLFEEYSEWPNLLDHLNRVGRQETPA
ncbi:MAG: hypothetical protein U5K37_01210 [Natrialbaceae archaeon]|nr:hypothetical protein [Natrialbaceae archaeon]